MRRMLGAVGIMAALAASAAMPVAIPVLRAEPPAVTASAGRKARGRQKAKLLRKEKQARARRWSSGGDFAQQYAATRKFAAGRSSTLKKTAKLLRMQAGRL